VSCAEAALAEPVPVVLAQRLYGVLTGQLSNSDDPGQTAAWGWLNALVSGALASGPARIQRTTDSLAGPASTWLQMCDRTRSTSLSKSVHPWIAASSDGAYEPPGERSFFSI